MESAEKMTIDPAANHPAADPATNDLLDEYSLQDVLEAPCDELDISGMPIDEFVDPIAAPDT